MHEKRIAVPIAAKRMEQGKANLSWATAPDWTIPACGGVARMKADWTVYEGGGLIA